MSEWISVKDRLPPCGKEILVWNKEHRTYVAFAWECDYTGKTFVTLKSSGCGCCDADVGENYYWMPLPKPPIV
jgi:hypothetical protein